MENKKGEDEHQIFTKIKTKTIKMIQKLAKVMKKKGWNVFTNKNYVERRKCKKKMSEVRRKRVHEMRKKMSGGEVL